MIRDNLIKQVENLFGTPSRETKKVNAWHPSQDFGFVIQMDTPQNGSYATVWIPDSIDFSEFSGIETEVYVEGRTRHSNTYQTPGLEKGEPCAKLKVRTQEDIDLLIKVLR